MRNEREYQVAVKFALEHARGVHQARIVTGAARISGADLRGRAKKYGGDYVRSAQTVIARCAADPRLVAREVIGDHNKRELSLALSDIGRVEAVKLRLLGTTSEQTGGVA